MDQTAAIAISLFAVAISALVVIRLNRADELADEQSDADSRTAALCNQIHVEGNSGE